MKRTVFCSVSALLLAFGVAYNASAVKHTVTVTDNAFTPGNILNVNINDTIQWVWQGPSAHTSTSTAIPGGASSWNYNLSGSATMAMYVPTVAGVYNYTCTIHSGMNGSFTVQNPTSVKNINAEQFSVSPNPAKTGIRIKSDEKEMEVWLTDIAGKSAQLQQINNTANEVIFPIPDVPAGVYILRIRSKDHIAAQKLLIER